MSIARMRGRNIMSALAGIYAFGGAPVDARWLGAMGNALARRGPDGGAEAILDSVGMTYRALHTNAESRRERQPLTWRSRYLLAWDGRLDNRDELIARLRRELRGEDTDAAIVAAACAQWGQGAFEMLIGDFALALWDRLTGVLCLARDCVGTRTLYYHVDDRRIIWATDLGALLDIGSLRIEVNDDYVAGFLTRAPDVGMTPYVGVHAVRPGHVVIVDRLGSVSEHRFWALDPKREIRYRTDAEYEEHFRYLFREAVRVRLRSDRPVFSELSGGLDSSSIVCVANDIVRAGEAPAPRLDTVSYVYDRAPSADETQWRSAVLDHCGLLGQHILESQHPVLVPSPRPHSFATPNWQLACSAYETRVRQLMSAAGSSVLLSGQGGDELLHSTHDPTPELSDLLAAGAVRSLHRRVRRWSELLRRPYWTVLGRNAIVPVLSDRSSVIRSRFGSLKQPAWLNREVIRMASNTPSVSTIGSRTTPGFSSQARAFESVVLFVAAGYREEAGGLHVAYPMLHRPLVEFLLAIPFDQKLRPGESRSIQRRGLRSLLPPALLARRGKRNPSEAMFRAFGRSPEPIRRLFIDSRASARGYTNKTSALRSLELAMAGVETHSAGLFKLVIVEMWLREVERRTAATSASAVTGGEHASFAAAPEGASPVAMRSATGW